MSKFSIDIDWELALNEPPEVAHTAGLLAIRAGDEVLTRNIDNWSRTVRNEARLSAYPLALWLAQSWWRLRYEILPVTRPNHAWRMGHELCAAGHGYAWPQLLFASEGDHIDIWSIPSPHSPESSVQYLAGGYQVIDAGEFERSIDTFISSTIARLDSVSIRATPLHDLWAEVMSERSDREMHDYRHLEALLGNDPGECPEEVINRFATAGSEIGAAALTELAPICAGDAPLSHIDQLRQMAQANGLTARIDAGILKLMHCLKTPAPLAAWEKGRLLAHEAREYFGLNGGAITDAQLGDMIGLPADQLLENKPPTRTVVGLAVRKETPNIVSLHLRKRSRTGRRFEISRMIADYVTAPESDHWLPVTDAKTTRQKTQRAFAAEFLAPIEGIRSFLDEDLSSDAIEEAAEHFGVASVAIQTQLVNSGYLQPEVLEGKNTGFVFPYSTGLSDKSCA